MCQHSTAKPSRFLSLPMDSRFSHFYETWFDQLHHLVHLLRSASKSPDVPVEDGRGQSLMGLVGKFMYHYAEYYRVKSLVTDHDALGVFAAPWTTSLERSLHWIAGWRPTTTFHLIYSESSILFESRIDDILQGLHTGDLNDLSQSQFRRVSELQCETVKEENEITDELSKWQDDASQLLEDCIDLNQRLLPLVTIIKKADALRLRTITNVVELLNPRQAVEFLIAASELQFGVRGLGINHDRPRGEETKHQS